MADHLRISRKGGGVLTAWLEKGEIFIRESLDRGKDVQTVAISRAELLKIAALGDEGEEANAKND